MVLDDHRPGAVQVGVHVRIPRLEVPLDEELVLLGVQAAEYQVIFAGDKPGQQRLTKTENACQRH